MCQAGCLQNLASFTVWCYLLLPGLSFFISNTLPWGLMVNSLKRVVKRLCWWSLGDVGSIKNIPVTGSSCIFNGVMDFTLQFCMTLAWNEWRRRVYEGDCRVEENIGRSSGIKTSQGTVSPSNFPELSTPAGGCGLRKIWRIKPVAAIKGQNLLFLKCPGFLKVWWETASLDSKTFI